MRPVITIIIDSALSIADLHTIDHFCLSAILREDKAIVIGLLSNFNALRLRIYRQGKEREEEAEITRSFSL